MSSFGIVEITDIVCHGNREFDDRGPLLPVEKLNLHSPPKCLHGGIIVAISNGSHRSHDPQSCDILRELPGGELSSVVCIKPNSA